HTHTHTLTNTHAPHTHTHTHTHTHDPTTQVHCYTHQHTCSRTRTRTHTRTVRQHVASKANIKGNVLWKRMPIDELDHINMAAGLTLCVALLGEIGVLLF